MDLVLQIAARIFVCRRRLSTDDVNPNASVDFCKQTEKQGFSDFGQAASDDASRSTESDVDSFDGSDSDTDDMDLVPNSEPSTAYNTDDEDDFSSKAQLPRPRHGTCLNPQAAPFVPLKHHTVASKPSAEDPNPRLSSLLEVLAKLTPQDAAVLRVFVENKLATEGASELAAQGANPAPVPQHTGSFYCQSQMPMTYAGWDANPMWNHDTTQEWSMS